MWVRIKEVNGLRAWWGGVLGLGLVVTGCGSAPGSFSDPPTILRVNSRTTVEIQWKTPPTALKTAVSVVRITPPPANSATISATLQMTSMSMPEESVTYIRESPGVFQGTVIPTMAGSWQLNLSIHTTRWHWSHPIPVMVNN